MNKITYPASFEKFWDGYKPSFAFAHMRADYFQCWKAAKADLTLPSDEELSKLLVRAKMRLKEKDRTCNACIARELRILLAAEMGVGL